MRTAAICPTCATYINAVCVLYDGPAVLTNIPASPLDDLDKILVALNTTIGGINSTIITIQTDITNIESDIVTIQGDIISIQGDITTIQGDITTIQNDITNINNAIANLDLQEVLDNGNSAINQPIILNNGRFYYTGNVTKNLFLGTSISSLPGTINIVMGSGAGTAMTGNTKIIIGQNAGSNSSGDQVIALGKDAAVNSSGVEVVALGTSSANLNNGQNLVAIGNSSGQFNGGNNVISLGYLSGNGNTGSSVLSVFENSCQLNTGNNVVAIGYEACKNNSANYVIAFGPNSCDGNSGSNVIAFGAASCNNNTGSNLFAACDFAANGNIGNNVVSIGLSSGLNNTHDNVNLFGQNAEATGNNQTVLGGTTYQVIVDYDGITDDRVYAAPDADGTLVLSVNGVAADAQGDVTISGLPYKSYVAKISQSGITPPTEDAVLYTSFSGPMTYSYINPGVYQITSAEITANTVAFLQLGSGAAAVSIQAIPSPGSIILYTTDLSMSINDNGLLTGTAIEIRVYP